MKKQTDEFKESKENGQLHSNGFVLAEALLGLFIVVIAAGMLLLCASASKSSASIELEKEIDKTYYANECFYTD